MRSGDDTEIDGPGLPGPDRRLPERRTIIDGLAFAKAVAHVSKTLIAGQRQAVRLAATGDGLRLDADGQYYSRADLDAETVEDGSAVVNGFWLSSVAAVMPSEELTV